MKKETKGAEQEVPGPTPEQIQIAVLTSQFRFIAGRHDEVLKRLGDALYVNSPAPISNAKAFVEREVTAANAELQRIVQGG